ncbi:hypothetical protein NFI96_020913 [Prochilodus magdalenae]|nr:hypothetical protein NFI96_020913 [Prochilodus magdalenae]
MAGAGSKGLMIFAAVLLIYIHMGYMHDIYSASDLIAEHSYADEHLYQLRQKREVNTNPVEYIAMAELTTASWITVNYVNAYLSKLGVGIPIENSTLIISLNISTVCQTAGTGTQCRCENSYVWPYDDCLTYQACDSISIGTCGCINGIPSSGQMCIPKSELPVIDFTVQIETNASTLLVNYIQSISSVQYANQIIEIVMMDVTTECSSVNTGYQCKCEDQYFWPCSKCQSYGYCDAITNNTCGCISAFPASGPYCQPITEIGQ